MRYKILRAALIAGVVIGFGSGFASLGGHLAHHRAEHHEARARAWAEACVDAAQRAHPTDSAAAIAPAPLAPPMLESVASMAPLTPLAEAPLPPAATD